MGETGDWRPKEVLRELEVKIDLESTSAEESGTPGTVPDYADPVRARLGWVDLLYGVIAQPSATFRIAAGGGYLRFSLLAFLLVQVVNWYLQIAFTARGTLAESLAREIPSLAPAEITRVIVDLGILLAVMGVIASFIFLFLGAGIFNLLAEILNGKGNARGLLAVLALTELPLVLGAPVQFLSFTLSWPSQVVTATSLGLWLWTAVLKVAAIRESTGLSTARAAAVYLIPWGAFLLILTTALVGVVVTIAPWLGELGR